MSESNQNEILLSAFLDGELSADELKKVQDLIAKDAHARFLLQQWQDQRDALKSLPTARLQKDLTADILNRLSSTATVENRSDLRNGSVVFQKGLEKEKDPARQFHWRLTYTIASALSAILLLSLLLFPLHNLFQPIMVAANRNSGMKHSVAPEQVASEQAIDSLKIAPGSPIASAEMDSDNKVSNEGDGAAREARKADLAVLNSSPATNKKILADPAPRTFGLAGGGVLESETASKGLEAVDEPMGAAVIGSGNATEIASHGNPPGKNEPAASGEDGVAGFAQPSDPTGFRRPSKSASADELVSINQVFFVDFSSSDAPLAVVSRILSRKGIVVLNELPADGQGQDKSKVDAMTDLYEQSPEGIEALFVEATRSQLSQAMQELLLAQANVSGFEVSANLLEQMKPKDASAGTDNSNLAGNAGLEPGLSGADTKGKLEKPAADHAQGPSLKSRQAMAQRIPNALKNKASRKKGAKGGTKEGTIGAEVNPGVLQGLLLSDLHWRSAQEAVDGIKKETSNDQAAKAGEAGEEEVVYYLLFVRAKTPK